MRLLQREVAAVRALRTRRFLGLELATVYVGPLLIVMPAGFGIYDGDGRRPRKAACSASSLAPAD